MTVSRHCSENGTWSKPDYTICLQYLVSNIFKTPCRKVNKTVTTNGSDSMVKEVVECEGIDTGHEDEAIRLLPIWFLTGYTISLIPVSLAIIIFWGIRYCFKKKLNLTSI